MVYTSLNILGECLKTRTSENVPASLYVESVKISQDFKEPDFNPFIPDLF